MNPGGSSIGSLHKSAPLEPEGAEAVDGLVGGLDGRQEASRAAAGVLWRADEELGAQVLVGESSMPVPKDLAETVAHMLDARSDDVMMRVTLDDRPSAFIELSHHLFCE